MCQTTVTPGYASWGTLICVHNLVNYDNVPGNVEMADYVARHCTCSGTCSGGGGGQGVCPPPIRYEKQK